MRNTGYTSIDEYIAAFPEDIQALLNAMRATIRGAAPDAEERISYQIPTFTLHGNLVHFAAFKQHIGFYPTSSGIAAFQRELAGYAQSKGAVQFPLDQPLPLELVAKITRFRVEENRARATAKAQRKRSDGAPHRDGTRWDARQKQRPHSIHAGQSGGVSCRLRGGA